MKSTCVVLIFTLLISFLALVNADPASYNPKSFYKLDSNGNRGHVFSVNPQQQANLQRRLKRQSFSSSSSSSSSSNGGPIFFTSSSSNSQIPPYGLQTRFGETIPVYGGYQSTSGVITPNGQVFYTANRGPF